jgi:hypothetical protein
MRKKTLLAPRKSSRESLRRRLRIGKCALPNKGDRVRHWRGETGSDDDNLFPGFLGRLRVRKIFDEPSLLEGGEKRALKVEISARRRPAYAGSVVLVLISGSFCSATLPKFLLCDHETGECNCWTGAYGHDCTLSSALAM